VTEGKLKRANAQAVIDGDLIYTSAKGQLRAVDNTGAVKWTSQDYGAGIAEMKVQGGTIFGRMGGEFFDDKERTWVLKKPLGVVAVDKSNGQMQWKYDGASDGITNLTFVDDNKTILLADGKNIIGLDTSAQGKVKEAYKLKVEFKQHTGKTQKAMKVARFGMGGLKGGLKGMKEDKKSEDHPVAIYHAEKGYAVVRGRQNITAFDPESRKIVWAVDYAPPGVSNFELIAMTAVYAFDYAQSTQRAASTYYGSWENTHANNERQNALMGYSKMLAKRYTATKATDFNAFMLTNVEADGDKGPGLVGVNMETGEPFGEVLLTQKDPDYVVDEITGRLFDRRGDTIEAYLLRD
jgi:outer membrane protein assembly factor BamB